jgi:starvation-inducible DNA-binding protein
MPPGDKSGLVNALRTVLAANYAMYIRAHSAHWNVKGPAFGAYHEFFEEIYEDLIEAADPIAEQILKMGEEAPTSLHELVSLSPIQETPGGNSDPASLVAELLNQNHQLLQLLMSTFDASNALNEQGCCNFLAERIDMHRKWNWQLSKSITPV